MDETLDGIACSERAESPMAAPDRAPARTREFVRRQLHNHTQRPVVKRCSSRNTGGTRTMLGTANKMPGHSSLRMGQRFVAFFPFPSCI
jgi:hypothetical protein